MAQFMKPLLSLTLWKSPITCRDSVPSSDAKNVKSIAAITDMTDNRFNWH